MAHTESNYVDTIQGIDVIKATNRESFFSDITKTVYGHFQNNVYQLGRVGLRFNLTAEIIAALLIAGLIALTSFLVVDKSLQLGEMMAVLTLTGCQPGRSGADFAVKTQHSDNYSKARLHQQMGFVGQHINNQVYSPAASLPVALVLPTL